MLLIPFSSLEAIQKMNNIHWIDSTVLLLYVGILIYIGFYRPSKRNTNPEDYFLAGRSLSFPAFVATLVTTWYGGILGVGENTFLYGIQTWFIFGLPYYLFALIYGNWVAPKIRQSNHFSIPDHFHHSFGKPVGVLAAIYVFILSSPAPYLLSMGILLQLLFQIPLWIAMAIASFISLAYVWNGGLRAVVRTDIFQFIMMFLGFTLLLIFAWNEVGSPKQLFSSLPLIHKSPLGGHSFQYVLVWFFIASWTFIDPGFYQRCASAKTPKIAKKGIFTSIIFWAVFDTLTLLTGLYAVQLISPENPLFTFPVLGQKILPPFVFGIFLVGIFSTIMSTIDSLSFVNSYTFGQDIYGRIKGLNHSIPSVKIGLILTTILAWVLGNLVPSVVSLFYTLGSSMIPGLIFPFIVSIFYPNSSFSKYSSLLWVLLPGLLSLIWLGLGFFTSGPFLEIEPFYPGMGLSIMIGIFILKQKKGLS